MRIIHLACETNLIDGSNRCLRLTTPRRPAPPLQRSRLPNLPVREEHCGACLTTFILVRRARPFAPMNGVAQSTCYQAWEDTLHLAGTIHGLARGRPWLRMMLPKSGNFHSKTTSALAATMRFLYRRHRRGDCPTPNLRVPLSWGISMPR